MKTIMTEAATVIVIVMMATGRRDVGDVVVEEVRDEAVAPRGQAATVVAMEVVDGLPAEAVGEARRVDVEAQGITTEMPVTTN
ncbi:hypothetical protein BIW11_06501 [Tropilaelaps mercedesae]|uniref:Uncharacterized protein n=1 Tax=Tropilaelaps mercedesae TaxID=418985 RepID=A0A1V9XXS3_9ACAR|nr:hypothetical protein BIW11_06501 [Tropilaelaps mercedesae]